MSDVWIIHIAKPLDSKDVEGKTEIVLQMTATKTGLTKKGLATLVMKLPTNSNSLKFKKAYYEAQYLKDAKVNDVIKLDDIAFENVQDESAITIVVESKLFFFYVF